VYRVRSEQGRPYALKLLPLQAGEWARREVALLLGLKHAHVVGFDSCGFWPREAPCFLYVVMEYVEGRRLDVWAQEENPGAREVAGKVLGAARGLAALHATHALHRDVKEANVLVRAGDGGAVLVDLGAGSFEGAPRITGAVLPPGTPEYRSPEAWRFWRTHAGKAGAAPYPPTAADDLYALGVVLYWLLTDRMPHEAADVHELADAVLRRVPRAPHALNPRVPEALSALCLRMLDKRVERRVPDAASLCEVLEALLAGADASWEVPLCDAYSASTATTEAAGPLSNADKIARWLKQDLGRPRRGPRPGAQAPELEPEAAPPPAGLPPEPPPLRNEAHAARAPSPSGTVRSGGRVAVRLGLALLVGTAVALGVVRGLAPDVGREVAPPERPPEAGRAAAPPEAASTPAAVAPRATPPKEDAPVKTPKKAGAPAPRTPGKRLGPLEKAAAVAATCTALGCPGVPVMRHDPPSEPCPPDAVETMERLRILILDKELASFHFSPANAGPITVREGSTSIRLMEDMGDIQAGATLSGRLIFGKERVYGRLTEAHIPPDGRRIPVCLELWDERGWRGVTRDDKGGNDTATVFSTVFVNPVREFE
jgi:serine/threonine protein kinase